MCTVIANIIEYLILESRSIYYNGIYCTYYRGVRECCFFDRFICNNCKGISRKCGDNICKLFFLNLYIFPITIWLSKGLSWNVFWFRLDSWTNGWWIFLFARWILSSIRCTWLGTLYNRYRYNVHTTQASIRWRWQL